MRRTHQQHNRCGTPTNSRAISRRAGQARGGFTLLEAAMSTVIIGVGVVAMVDAQSAFVQANLWSSHAATGTYLANEIREMTRHLPKHDPVTGLFFADEGDPTSLRGWGPDGGELTIGDFDDLDDFDGLSLSWFGTAGHTDGDLPGPVDAFGNIIREIPLVDPPPTIDPDTGEELPPEPQGPIMGWTQRISVDKLEPFNNTVTVADNMVLAGHPTLPDRAVNQFSLLVTVETLYQPPFEAEAEVISSVSWIVP